MRLSFAFLILPTVLLSQQQVIQIYPALQAPPPAPGGSGGIVGGIGSSPFFTQGAPPNGQPGAPQAQPSMDCTYDGMVVNQVTGAPIPRASMALNGPGGQTSVSASASGMWRFVNAPCGRVQITATRPGFIPGMPPSAYGRWFTPTALEAGGSVHNMKIELVPQAAVVGHVLDEDGDPVQSVSVSAMVSRIVMGRRSFQPSANTQTNDLGEYRLAGLPAGRYIICARSLNQGGPNAGQYGDRCYPGPVEDGSPMPLAAGSDTKVDFTLPRSATVRVRGVVLGLPKNQGVAVTMMKRGAFGAGPIGATRPAMVQPDGKFAVTGVTPGSYLLMTDYWEAGKRLTAHVPLEVGSADVEGVTVRLEPGFTVTGKVRYETRPAAANRPAQQFNINLRTADGLMGGGQVVWNADRTVFTVADMPAGSYRLDGFAGGGLYLKSALLGGRDLAREDVTIGPSSGAIEVVVSDSSGAVEGQVVGADDQPVASWVMALGEGQQPHSVRTDASGKYKLAGLAPGDYKLYAWDDVQQVEYANPDFMRRYPSASVSVQADQTAQAGLKQSTVPPLP